MLVQHMRSLARGWLAAPNPSNSCPKVLLPQQPMATLMMPGLPSSPSNL